MNEPDEIRRQEVQRWFDIVAEDIDVARASAAFARPRLGSAAYHLQQACEKFMKGLLVAAGQRIRKTHDLDELASAVTPFYPDLASSFDAMRGLTIWGIAYRYPGMDDTPEPEPSAAEIEDVAHLIETLMNDLSSRLTLARLTLDGRNG